MKLNQRSSIKIRFLLFFMSVATLILNSAVAAPLELKQGKWIGRLRFPNETLTYGTTVDFFLAQSNSLREFPRLEGLVRISSGGPMGSERVVTHFENVQYDFNTGAITLDDEKSEMLVRLQVTDITSMNGTFVDKSSGKRGTLSLRLADTLASGGEPCEPDEPCEPPDDPSTRIPRGNFKELVVGAYNGVCANKQSRLEISGGQSSNHTENPFGPQKHSVHRAVLGMPDFGQCRGTSDLCVIKSWNNVISNSFGNTLQLVEGNSSDTCVVENNGKMNCSFRVQNQDQSCLFERATSLETNYNPKFRRALEIVQQPSDLDPLPAGINDLETLRTALEDDFSGYLALESNGSVIPISLTNTASISTDNPHNEPFVYISGSLRLRTFGTEIVTRFDRRTFFPTPGMALRSESSDLFAIVSSWSKNIVRGEIYDNKSGRLGTFVLKRGGATLTNKETQFVFLGGRYQSRSNQGPTGWKLNLQIPKQVDSLVMRIDGDAQMEIPGLPFPRLTLTESEYDFSSDKFVLNVTESNGNSRQLMGERNQTGGYQLQVGSSSNWGVKLSPVAHQTLLPVQSRGTP